MTNRWKRLSTLIVASAALALAFGSTGRSDEPEKLPEAPATEGAEPEKTSEEPESEPQLEVDEDEGGKDVGEALEKAAEKELGDATKESSAEDLLNLATELKLSAQNIVDYTKVISLCNKAEKLGLDETNAEFSKQLRLSARLERGLAISQLFLNPDLEIDQLPRGWEGLRDGAIGDLRAALEENPDIAVANLSLGRLFMLAERADDAKKALDAAIDGEDAETDVKTLALMFRALLENDARTALPFVEKALSIDPDGQPRLYSQYSAYLQLLGRTDEAIKQIDKAIELDPETPDYKKEKALLLAKIKRYDEARALFDEATKDADLNVSLQVEKAQFLASIDDTDGALAVYSKLLEKFDGPGIYCLRGILWAQKKDYRKALADANQALRRDANLLPAIRLKGVVYLEMEKYDDAIRTFENLRSKTKDDEGKLEATSQIAYAVSKTGRYKKASGILKAELEKRPDNPELLRTLADMELSFGHWGAANEIYEKLIAIDPKDSGVLNNFSWLLATCPDDQFRNAARALEFGKLAAEETMYAAPHILSTLAAAYAENGDFESARSWSQKAVELGEKENHDSLESLKKELESYKENKPWRETSDIIQEVEEDESESSASTEEKSGEDDDAEAPAESEEKTEEKEAQ
ncbi:MAG: tetratricopeptide repeat protein [Thermoguttaceae bacterium]|nr:tetratricopeptide repeat protein [Thermoguttaceae bacterium]